MQKNINRAIACAAGTLRQVLRVSGCTQVLKGILFLILSHECSQAFSATLPIPASVNLKWNRSPSSEVTGYRIYYGAASRSYSTSIMVGNVTNNTVLGLNSGDTYFFTVAAYTASGLESPFSNELLYIVPGGLAQLQIRITASKQAIITVIGQVGHTYEIQAATDFKTWTVLGTVNTGASGTVSYTNTNAGTFTKRFYRTRDTQP